jgi:hypothetical protein
MKLILIRRGVTKSKIFWTHNPRMGLSWAEHLNFPRTQKLRREREKKRKNPNKTTHNQSASKHHHRQQKRFSAKICICTTSTPLLYLSKHNFDQTKQEIWLNTWLNQTSKKKVHPSMGTLVMYLLIPNLLILI